MPHFGEGFGEVRVEAPGNVPERSRPVPPRAVHELRGRHADHWLDGVGTSVTMGP